MEIWWCKLQTVPPVSIQSKGKRAQHWPKHLLLSPVEEENISFYITRNITREGATPELASLCTGQGIANK
jgi:hypothetical protein